MTSQKHLKQRVRARMADTGERYAAARHHVTGASVKAASGAVPATDGPTEATAGQPDHGIHAETWALRTALARLDVGAGDSGRPPSEAGLLLLGGGIGMGIFAFHYAAEDFSSFYVAGRHLWDDSPAFLREAATRLGLQVDVLETAGARTAETQLIAALDEGRGVIASVDIEALGTCGWPPRTSGGGYHVVTVLGVDRARSVVTIQDVALQPVEVPADVFARARARIKSDRHRLVTIARPAGGRVADPSGSAIADALRSCADGLEGTLSVTAGGHRGRNFTLDALATWADRLAGNRSADGWPRAFARGHRLWRGLSSIWEFVEHAGTGGGLLRPLYARGLAEAAAATRQPTLAALSSRYAALGAAWTDLARAALPADVPELRETADLMARRERTVRTAGPGAIEEAKRIWQRLSEIEAEMHDDFPLSQAEIDVLLIDLQRRVRLIEAAERDALGALRVAAATIERAGGL